MRIGLSVAVWAMAMAVVATSHAQSPQYIAPPITSDDLDEYSTILDLSDAQRAAIEPLFSDYKERYKALLEGEVAALNKQFDDEAERNPDWWQDIGIRRRRLRDIERLQSSLGAIEQSFFESWLDYLTDQQRPRITIVQKLRLRQRYLGRVASRGPIRFIPLTDNGLATDLRRQLRSVDPTGAERQAIEPILLAYETDLTARIQRHHADAMRLYYASDDYEADLPRVVESGQPILVLHRRTMETILPLLDEARAAALRDNVLMRLYPGVQPDAGDATWTIEAIELQSLNDEQRQQVEALRESHDSAHAALSGQIIALLDEAMEDADFWNTPGSESGARRQPPHLRSLG